MAQAIKRGLRQAAYAVDVARDGEDAQLMRFEDRSGDVIGLSYQPSDMRLSFVHHVRRSAFLDYELQPLPEKMRLAFYRTDQRAIVHDHG